MKCWGDMRRSDWVFPTAILSLYGFFANCRPAEPFLTPYLVGPKNISEEVVTNYLFPIWTYSYLSLLCPVFLLTDFLRYKPIIVTQGLFLVINYVLLCFAHSLTAMTYLQFNFAMVTSTEVGYFSYIYSVIPPERYQQATGYVRSAMLTGYTFGATLGQLLISLADTSYFHINTITLGLMGVALLISLSLPMPKNRMFFKSGVGVSVDTLDEEASEGGKEAKERCCAWENVKRSGRQMWESLRESYSSMKMLKWSLWWALATAGYGQVFNYVQLMWDHIEPSSTSSVYNGGVEAVCTLVGAAAAFSVGHIRVQWGMWGELSLGVFSAVGAGCVFLMGLTNNIWLCYTGYAIFKASYMFLITMTMFQIAVNLSMECYALTFGINTFVALTLQTILTAIVVDNSALGLDIVTQFLVYGGYYCIISVLFLTQGVYTVCKHCHKSADRPPENTDRPPQETLEKQRVPDTQHGKEHSIP
ncbi:solute carrier family 19 member 3b [Triplophysa rosa]|uniref:Thiamine transporter 2 n=1 Tax=Triplophysa rosa TaxID=992332 RepID=A0A9W7WK08_TRIRA|nr:solute carrier family 19 member 3b [Triplophysa rosa]KAI7802429.1 putative thiamine transporter 2 [Triplophysa rosa]